jgi:23S rRNA (uracil1939-C5)-methyltransferase
MPPDEVVCRFASECSGCTSWQIPLSEQLEKKRQSFLMLTADHWGLPLPEIEVHSLGPGFLRDRLDFTLENGNFGLVKQDYSNILDLPECLQLSPELQGFLAEFRKVLPPVKKGSVRLRISADGKRGIWLDFANKDIQHLFAEKTALKKILALGFVEVGQRRKKLIWEEEPTPRFRLESPELHPWTRSYSRGQPIDLYGYVSSFTQTGLVANRKIAEVLERLLLAIPNQTANPIIYEFGAGLGTLTLPTLKVLPRVKLKVFESDQLSLQGLKETLSKEGLNSSVEIFSGDFQKELQSLSQAADIILLNPPRSGVGKFMQQISNSTQAIVYMSCFAKSMVEDCKNLGQLGFRLQQIHMIDQFPQTDHAEWLTLWARD